jgi:hypothetical protein
MTKKLLITKRMRRTLTEISVTPADITAISWLTPHIAALMDQVGADLHIPQDPYFYLRAAVGPNAKAIMAVYDSLSREDAARLPMEAFVLAAGVDPNIVADLITASLATIQRRMVTVRFSSGHTAVTDATIKNALEDNGYRDRAMVHKIMGALPVSKGAQTIVNIQQNAMPSATVAAPPPENTIKRLAERVAAARPRLSDSPPEEVRDAVDVAANEGAGDV